MDISPNTPSASGAPNYDNSGHHLHRRFGLLQATALNMSNMVGVGPFITIPLLMSAMGGPQAMLGWFCAMLICIPDSLVWSELGAAMPGSGGTYVYLREGFGRHTWGRLMAFLFIWQFMLSGPMEIASGYIGFGKYMAYIWPGMTETHVKIAAMGVGLLTIAMLYRRIGTIGKLTVSLWVGMLITTGLVVVSGVTHFDPKVAFDFPPDAFHFSLGFFMGLGAAARVGIYDYLGYYDVCYIGDEVRDPGRVIPRSVLFSLIAVAGIYLVMNLSLVGFIPWREFVPADEKPEIANFVFSIFMERIHGSGFATVFTLMILWTTFASVFALMLGYSRIPYAAAKDGVFFRVFENLHPTKDFPHLSLLLIGGIAILACFFSLGTVIEILLATRILIQFIGQIGALILLRRHAPGMVRPYKMWLYPLPCVIAFLGWAFVFLTSPKAIVYFSLLTLVLGIGAYFLWARNTSQWPFEANTPKEA
ncbi:MAG: APC family permease [Candidatus Omnitrophica bacterium]|nr:putative fructoselysine/psicoselysine transporter FrlA [bacterium]NUN97301.1 APC family permease [Candidatus Omnitrophota bacterium]